MGNRPDPNESASAPVGHFRTTHWTTVLLAGRDSLAGAREALESLVRTYWYPLYAFARRKGQSHEDAQDLVQGFFGQLLERGDLANVHPDKGRFRTFLLAALGHFMANEWHRARALKRGGGASLVSLDADPDGRYHREQVSDATPEALYDQAWAGQVLAAVLARLRDEAIREGGLERFEALKGFLLGEKSGQPYAELATRLATTESAIKSAVHRLRQRLRVLFREEIARTVSCEAEIDDELRHLVRIMTR